MFPDLVRKVNQEILDFLRRHTPGGGRAAVISSITADSLQSLYKRLEEVGRLLPWPEEAGSLPEISEYERNLTELKALLEQAQIELAARREVLQAHLGKLRSASAWAQTLEQTR